MTWGENFPRWCCFTTEGLCYRQQWLSGSCPCRGAHHKIPSWQPSDSPAHSPCISCMGLLKDRMCRKWCLPCQHTHFHSYWSGCCHTNNFHCNRYRSGCRNIFRCSKYRSSSSWGTRLPFDSTGAPQELSFASSTRHRWHYLRCPPSSWGS